MRANANRRFDSGSSSIRPYKSGPGGDRGSIDQALSRPTLSTSQISLQSNVTTSLPLLVRPWSQGWEKKYNQGSMLFCYQNDGDPRMTTALDIPCINYVLQSAARRLGKKEFNIENNPIYPKSGDGPLRNDDFKYGFFGVVRNDMAADSTLQRLFNCDVFGRSMVANIFSGKPLKRGDVLSLAIVKMDCHAKYEFFVLPEGTRQPSMVTDKVAYQVVGMCNGLLCGHSNPPSASNPNGSNMVAPDQTVKEICREIPIGMVSHAVARIPSEGQITQALRDQDRFTLLPRVEVLLA